jgi:hypothetical protein
MTKDQFIISESEKERILGMHKDATKRNYIFEITRDEFTEHIINMLEGQSPKLTNFLLKQLTQQSGGSLGNNAHLLCHDEKSTTRCPNWPKYRESIGKSIINGLSNDSKFSGKKDKENLKKVILIISKVASEYYQKSKSDSFIETLFQQLDKNQNGILRSLSTLEYKQDNIQGKSKKEHLIPSNLFRKELIDMVKSGDFSNFDTYANQMVQVILSDEDDMKLKKSGYNMKMPDGWKWGDDPWVRYSLSGIDLNTIKKLG